MSDKIVITGMGAVTPLGNNVPEYLENLLEGRSGITKLTKIDSSAMAVKYAGQIKNFAPPASVTPKMADNMDHFMLYAFAAAEEAIAQSGLDTRSDRVGLAMGSAIDGFDEICRVQKSMDEGKKVGPRFVAKTLGNIAVSHIAIAHGITGPSMTVNTACSSGNDSISLAAMMLLTGEADAIVTVGAESAICPPFIMSLARAGAMSVANVAPEESSRPFDLSRTGFVLGEGGGALILETEKHALDRGAEILAELAGWGNTNDAFHIIAPHPEGKGAAVCMRRALQRAGLNPSDIDYINAHGTATVKGDEAEAKAIHLAFGEAAGTIPVSSTKGATGHMMGAGGVTEVIACINALRTGILPPNLNYVDRDPVCDLNIVTDNSARREIKAAMSNALGFGGQNSSIIVRRY